MTNVMLRKRPFQRLVREIAVGSSPPGPGGPLRFKPAVIGALQEAAEAFLVREFKSKFVVLPE